jgi:hypothetical protein
VPREVAVALQGTLETFSVPEVLRLLAGTAKTGLLALDGDRGEGRVWLADGRIVEARSDHEQGDRVEAVLFDLLRFRTGSFVFDSGAAAHGSHDTDVEEVLGQAERMLERWHTIEAVVPSMDARVRMVDELAAEAVTVTAEQWRSLAVVGRGMSVRHLGANHGLGEFDTCDLVRELVESGLVDVSDEQVELVPGPEADPAPVDHDLSDDEVASLGENLAGFVARPSEQQPPPADPVIGEPGVDDRAAALPSDLEPGELHEGPVQAPDHEVEAVTSADHAEPPFAQALDVHDVVPSGDHGGDGGMVEPDPQTPDAPAVAAPAADVPAADVPAADVPASEDIDTPAADTPPAGETRGSDEFLSQLSSFSPKAAAALEATADEESDVEAGPEVQGDDEDEELNRNLLLKFLSSAKN